MAKGVYYEVHYLRGHPEDCKKLFWMGAGLVSDSVDSALKLKDEDRKLNPDRVYRIIKFEIIYCDRVG